ncbi:TonB-dependent receptor [Erythrobacter mangrovi]|uniref:TonB-dependent receptor n=1 Tax=Erythrobacter mangrovi TaxID=2739433 RepID=A0A7D3XKF7_9SPHN|nr:TonB-dependent receptor [Erythrobacter mangrovi]
MRSTLLCLLAGTALVPFQAVHATESEIADSGEAAASDENQIIVFGKGQTRQTGTLDEERIAISTPAISPLKAIARLPGVNFQSSDPFGNYEWSQRISIRGFNQNQLGYTFDGVPLGDASYGNHNGLHISRVISQENIGSIAVTQGAGNIGVASTNNLGGTVETSSQDPEGRLAVLGDATYGRFDTYRGFLRLNYGTPGGASGYVSYGYYQTDKWKGYGEQRQHMVNAKLTIPVGSFAIDGWYSYSDRAEQDYQDFSLEQIDRLGYFADNLSYERLELANLVADVGANTGYTGATPQNPAAGTTYPAPYTSPDDAYLDAAGLRRDHLAYLRLHGDAGQAKLALTGYYHTNEGQGLWGTPYVPSPTGGSPYSIRTTEYDIERTGVLGTASLPVAGTDLTLGLWYENNDFHQARRFYALTSRTEPGRSFLEFQSDPFFTQWEFDFNTKTYQYHVEDSIQLDALKLNLGWKGFRVENNADPVISGGRAVGSFAVEDWFQPHAGVTYDLGQAEIFAGFTQVTRAFASATTAGPFATSQAGFDSLQADGLRPETSNTYEIGVRYNTPIVNAVLAGYYVDFDNRIIAFANGAGIVGNPAILRNVGSVRSIGIEAAADVKLNDIVGFYASYAYNDSTYRNDVLNADSTLYAATRGKTVVDSPKHILHAEVNFDTVGFFGNLGMDYQSKRYFTYENDQSVGGRVTVDAALGYRFDDHFELRLNATNLFNERYIGTIGTNGFGNRGDNQTLQTAAPRAVFATLTVKN